MSGGPFMERIHREETAALMLRISRAESGYARAITDKTRLSQGLIDARDLLRKAEAEREEWRLSSGRNSALQADEIKLRLMAEAERDAAQAMLRKYEHSEDDVIGDPCFCLECHSHMPDHETGCAWARAIGKPI